MRKAVITGDIIHSTRMDSEILIDIFQQLEKELKELEKQFKVFTEIFRGDSFQCLVENSASSLKVALIIKTFLRGMYQEEMAKAYDKRFHTKERKKLWPMKVVDARMTIGIGNVDVLTEKLGTSNGIAFILSGRLLDQLKDSKQHLAITSDDEYDKEWYVESILLDAIISKASGLQCQVLHYKLKGLTEVEIAKNLSIGQSAVNQRANGGNWNAIQAVVKRFEEVYETR